MTRFTVSEDAEMIYDGSAIIKKYGASTKAKPFFGIGNVDDKQFEYARDNIKSNTPVRIVAYTMEDEEGSALIVLNWDGQFVSAYEGSSSGRWMKFTFHDTEGDHINDMINHIRQLVGEEYRFSIWAGEVAEREEKQSGGFSQYWRKLYMTRFLVNSQLCAALGSEERHLAWIRKQKCLVTKKGDWVEGMGEYRCEAAHVRKIVEGAGMAIKPPYFAIPLSHDLHALQHGNGIEALWRKAHRPTPPSINYPISSPTEHAQQWLSYYANRYRQEWVKHEIKMYFGVVSATMVSPEMLRQLLEDKNIYHIEQLLPTE